VRAGLIAARAVFEVSDDGITQAVADIEKVLINATSQRGYVPKSLHAKTLEPIADVDASAYWTASPFGFFPADSAVMWATDHEIGNQGLVSGTGGVHRHNSTPYREGIPLVGERGDGYYGGGLWVSLTAARGVWLAGAGQTAQAELCLQWILAHAQPNGDLAEQISDDLLRPGDYEYWRQHWGAPASPLTWAHAEFVRLAAALDQLA
jgi:GH15 family glucan-1,4-alpha-glucosidase